MRILVSGPLGAGKSVLVRRVMSLYDRRKIVQGGVGGLPLAYTLSRVNRTPAGEGHYDEVEYGRLEILGNYELSFRNRHGLTQFCRYHADFLHVLRHARKIKYPVLCEGGFLHPRRLDTDEGREFCNGATIVWMAPLRSEIEIDRAITKDGYERRLDAARATCQKMIEMGAEFTNIIDREEALRYVCQLIDPSLDVSKASAPTHDYR